MVSYEQPYVNFQGDHLLHCVMKGNDDIISTSIDLLDQEINTPSLKGLLFKIKRVDRNSDQRFEFFDIETRIYFSATSTNVESDCSLYLIADYGLRDRAVAQMRSPVHFRFSRLINENVFIIGDINLSQKNPLPTTMIPRSNYNYTVPIVGVNQYNLDLMSFLRDANARNETLHAKYHTTRSTTNSNANYFTVNLILQVPMLEDVHVIPSIRENMKQIWQYYVYSFIPIYWLLGYVIEFALNNNIFKSSISNNIPDKSKK